MEISANSLETRPYTHFFYSCVNTARKWAYEHENKIFLVLLELCVYIFVPPLLFETLVILESNCRK